MGLYGCHSGAPNQSYITASGPKYIDLSTRDKLRTWLDKEQIETLFASDSFVWPSEGEASVALFTSGWDFITSFKKHRNDF